jgi:DNA polymerase III alpha subunit
VALAIKDGLKIYDESRRKPKGQFHIMTEEEIRTILINNNISDNVINKLIETNNALADQIDVSIDLNQSLFPNYETPDDVNKIYEDNKNELITNK